MIKDDSFFTVEEEESVYNKSYTLKTNGEMDWLVNSYGMLLTGKEVKDIANRLYEFAMESDDELIEKHNEDILNRENELVFGRCDNVKTVNKKGYVYLLKSETGETKIGRTLKIDQRIFHFTTNLPYELSLILYTETDDYLGLERRLHEEYSDKRLRGEWFNLTDEDIKNITERQGMTVYYHG